MSETAKECKSCLYFRAGTTREHRYGECRRNPPLMNQEFKTGVWPAVMRYDWCGEFVAKQIEEPKP